MTPNYEMEQRRAEWEAEHLGHSEHDLEEERDVKKAGSNIDDYLNKYSLAEHNESSTND